jgi:hypothetical protein
LCIDRDPFGTFERGGSGWPAIAFETALTGPGNMHVYARFGIDPKDLISFARG